MRKDALATRARLVAAAETLFARDGVDAVSLNEVQRAAGQRNKSALQYHFGTKENLLEAILEKHVPAIELRRHRMLDELEARGGYGARELMQTLVVPVFDKLDDPDGGAAYVAVYAELVASPRNAAFWQSAMSANRGADRLMRLLGKVCPPLPVELRLPRYLHITELLFHGIRDLGRLGAIEPGHFPPTRRALHVEHLTDLLTALVLAPVSPATAALLSPKTPSTI